MNPQDHSDFTVLGKLVDGLLSAGELEQLEERLMTDAEFRHRYVQFLDLDFELSQRLSQEEPAVIDSSEPVVVRPVRTTPSTASPVLSVLKVAAVLVLGLGAWLIVPHFNPDPVEGVVFSQPAEKPVTKPKAAETTPPAHSLNNPHLADDSRSIATVSEDPVSAVKEHPLSDPDDAESLSPPTSIQPESIPVVVGSYWVNEPGSGWSGGREEITTGEHEVKQGTVEFRLDTGVRVTVEGPARFAIESGMKMRLITGRIAAEVFATAIGFQVEANSVTVTDFGTRFAVTANTEGDTAVHVYDGAVKAATGRQGDGEPRMLVSDDTMRLNLKTGLMEQIRFDEKLFAAKPAWTGSIEWYSADVEILPKPPREANQYELPINHPVVFKEREGVFLRRPVPVNYLPAVTPSTDEIELEIPKGRTLSSYCLHGSRAAPERISGQIRFDSPVLGIIYDSTLLDETDRALGARRTDYPAGVSYRGIEPGDLENKNTLVVEQDGRTVRFSFSAPNFDQFRILVAED